MKYSEIFTSIQGEGAMAGAPSTFIRFSMCDLRCWWCDTPYTSWVPEQKQITTPEIMKQIPRDAPSCTVITGGEPMLWGQPHELPRLTDLLKRRKQHITIETNGRHFVPDLQCDLMSISPKLKSSTPMNDDRWRIRHDNLRINLDSLLDLIRVFEYQLKFVVDSDEDMKELLDLITQLDANPKRVFLMPQARNREQLQKRQEWVIGLCMKHDFRYSPRLHIDVWGNRRGT